MNLNVQARQSDGVTILEVEGRILVGDSSAHFHKVVRDQLQQGARKLLLLLRGVTYVDSAGVGELVGAYTAARSAGAELRLADLTPKVRDLMAMTNLNQVFDLNLTEESALKALRAGDKQ
ncbi:MAG TPA: STAS domain-containing protein [Terriglobales bacterium]|nr:STAS domain-containing protein [Terriglobales bacterium]